MNTNCTSVSCGDRAARVYAPAVKVSDAENAWTLSVDVPGVTRENVELNVEDNVLTIHAIRKQATASAESQIEYWRSFSLGTDVNVDGITATVRDGVLTVTLPKSASAKPRKIEVKAE